MAIISAESNVLPALQFLEANPSEAQSASESSWYFSTKWTFTLLLVSALPGVLLWDAKWPLSNTNLKSLHGCYGPFFLTGAWTVEGDTSLWLLLSISIDFTPEGAVFEGVPWCWESRTLCPFCRLCEAETSSQTCLGTEVLPGPCGAVSAHPWRDAVQFFPPVQLDCGSLRYFQAGCTSGTMPYGRKGLRKGLDIQVQHNVTRTNTSKLLIIKQANFTYLNFWIYHLLMVSEVALHLMTLYL